MSRPADGRDESPGPPAAAWRPVRTVAAVLAGGTGSRFGAPRPKQLLEVAGRSVLAHSIAAFEATAEVDEIVVLMAPDFVDEARRIVTAAGFGKVSQVLAGGRTRNESTRRALAALPSDDCAVLFHDAARPLVSPRIIRDCVRALATYPAVGVAVPSTDTVVAVDDAGLVADVPARERLRRCQTPQGFRCGTIREAYRRAAADAGFRTTDDCGVVRRYLPEVPIKMIEGAEENIKITHPVDLRLAEELFRLASGPPAERAQPPAGAAGPPACGPSPGPA